MGKALYELIAGAAVDGRLPEDFSLPREDDGRMPFADGAMDGIMIYHHAASELTEAQLKLIADTVEAISAGDFYNAEELVWRIADEIGARAAFDAIRRHIIDNAAALDLDNLYRFGAAIATQSDRRALVKLALAVLSPFRLEGESRGFIRTRGLSDEFTLYAAVAMGAWDGANAEWFDLARRVRGWGRIHLVERIRPETEEIRRWLMREGVHNDVLPAYSALTCWSKADVPSALAGPLSREDFTGIRDIIEALLDEGPVPGISAVENAQAHLLAFLDHAKGMALDDDDRSVIAYIRDRFGDSPGIVAACNALS